MDMMTSYEQAEAEATERFYEERADVADAYVDELKYVAIDDTTTGDLYRQTEAWYWVLNGAPVGPFTSEYAAITDAQRNA